MPTYTRISARKGSVVRLNISFYANGVLADPFAIRKINIYQNTAASENLLLAVEISKPSVVGYPSPLVRESIGKYHYDLTIPDDFPAPDSYVDKWFWVGDEFIDSGGTTEINLDDETLWDSQCSQFFVVASNTWYADDGLIVPRIAFEAIDKDIVKPAVQTIEVGLMPLPRYDYDYNRIAPMMAHLIATIDIETLSCEPIVSNGLMTMGLRQGTHRSDPFVAQYQIDTALFLKGTYRYRVILQLPNGETRVSPHLQFTIR